MRFNASVRFVVVSTCAAISLGCARGPRVALEPVPCPEVGQPLLAEQVEMVTTGDYPLTALYLAALEDVCCRNAAIAGRDTSWCEAPVEEE